MQVINQWEDLTDNVNGRLSVIIGNFDGIHCGHQELLAVAKQNAGNNKTALLTFEPHPMELFQNKILQRLTTKSEMLNLLEQFQLDYWLDLSFHVVVNLRPEAFIQLLTEVLQVDNITVGYDFKFGKHAVGSIVTLQELSKNYDFNLKIVPPVYLPNKQEKISSTYIRNELTKGNIEEANIGLGRAYQLSGQVVHGLKRGRTLGFPTANIAVADNKLIPADGVYAGVVNKVFNGAINIGFNPSFGNSARTIEVHLLDYTGDDLYGSSLTIELTNHLRGEIAFTSKEQLIEQVKKDIASIRKLNPAKLVYKP